MNLQATPKSFGRRLIPSKPAFVSAITIILLTVLAVWLWGTTIHRTVFGNALLSTNILAAICIASFTIGLFNGVKLKDTLGRITDKFEWKKLPDFPKVSKFPLSGGSSWGNVDLDEFFFEILLTIIISIITLLLSLFLFWLFGNLFWAGTLIVEATLYWIFFRAVRQVLKNAGKCRGKWMLSFMYGFVFTVGYSFLFYAVILIPHFLNS